MESADVLMEEKKLMAEAKYRNYMSNIDKALRNFEYSSEWADLISALGKLSKAISSNTQYQVIPRRIKISKRLAQCMHPALPSGVHLKALETYAVIFAKTGPERLATELFIYSSGLFPLLGYAAMNVRPALLGIYETYFVPLGEKLRPALSGFLSGVLPGYECGLDHFERTSSLLTQVCTAVNPTHFYTVLWECVATNASVRLPAISYLLEHFNKRTTMQEQIYVMGHNRDIMMSGLCACLNDSVILVQRNTLEFLLLGFPMHTKLLTEMDLIKLVTNGLHTILRRDMSLNRRLYSWLLGSEVMKNSPTYEAVVDITDTTSTGEGAEQTKSYFEKHSRHVVIQAIISTLKFSLQCTPVDLKPYRIMVSLLDKAEIGSAVLDYVLCDIIRTMSLSNGNVEVIKSSNLLFATFDPAYIWSFMTTMFEKSCKKTKKVKSVETNRKSYNRSASTTEQRFQCVVGSGDPSLVEICYLTEFLLETISLEMYNETTRIYLPKVFLAITQMLTVHLENLSNKEFTASLKLCMKIVSRVQPMITSPIKLMPRSAQQNVKLNDNDKTDNSSNRAQPLASALGSNALEKSKSDSKLDQFANPENLNKSMNSARDEEHIRRSNSNQHMERKSPTKKKKAKSFSKLSELDKEICPDTGQIIDPRQSSSDLDTPTSIKKIKAKAHRLRMSPKKSRPQELNISQDKSNINSNRDSKNINNEPGDTPDYEYQEDEPKSAPLEQLNKHQNEGFVFNYQDLCNQDNDLQQQEAFATSSILEKCIKQYEIFFEVYLSHKVLQITPGKQGKCSVKVQIQNPDTVEDAENKVPNVENIFKHEQVYEDINPGRLLDIDNLFETLKIHVVNRSKQLHSLLNRSLNDAQSENTDGSDNGGETVEDNAYEIDDLTKKRIQTLLQLQLSSSLRQAIKLSVNLLVEMSTFPNCNKNITLEKNEHDLPSWLKVLCIVACYTQNDKELQLSSITTLFDLISLLKSQIEHTTSPGVTFVVMLPLLKFGHVHYIERRTKVFQLLASKLWDYLGEPEVDNTQVCALLYQLHNCLESGLIERIIDNRMFAKSMQQHFTAANEVNENKHTGNRKQDKFSTQPTALNSYNNDRAAELHMMCVAPSFLVKPSSIEKLSESESISFKKYELLWHLGRDKQQTRGFEKLQFKVLDTLALPPYMSVRTCVTKWLQAALLRGDLSRLVKPLYKILLASNTKRIGIVHLHILQKGNDENSDKTTSLNDQGKNNNPLDVDSSVEADIYAVSSEYGNIRYITDSTSHHKKRSPIRTFHKKIFGVALSSKNKTSNFVSEQTASQSTSPHNVGIDMATAAMAPCTPIGVIVNPLENSVDFDDDQEPDTQEVKEKIIIKETQMEEDDPEDLEEDENDDAAFDQDYTDESDSSIFDSESEQRETSVEKDDSITQTYDYENKSDLKRYVGHTESVTELLSQHERTKNRKTYHLTREKTPGETSLTSTTTDEHGPLSLEMDAEDEDAHAAEEYFDTKSEERQVESFVEDLIDQVRDSAISKRKKKLKNRIKKLKSNKSPLGQKDKMDSKRMSCISKISTDSNTSFTTGEIAKESAEDEDDSTSKFINIEEKRKNLNLETTAKTHIKEWELTPETIEKSKQNLEILRQSAASSQLNKQGMSSKRSSTKSCTSFEGSMTKRYQNEKLMPVYQNHMLIYTNVYDTKQTLYAFHTLRNIISCDTRTFLCLSITTSLSSSSLKQLLTRHRKCIAGKGFAGSITTSEFAQSYRGCMHLEVLLLLCLFYARGFFHIDAHDSASEPPTRADVIGNCRVQLESIELLTLICAELIEIVKGMGKGLACYLADLMVRCKLQKVILHCLNSSVNTYGHHYMGSTMAEQIINFNNPQDDNLHAEAFQIQLLRLLMVVIKLEYEVALLKNDTSVSGSNEPTDSGSISPTRLTSGESSLSSVKYLPNCVISQQPMFLSAILSALQDERLQPLHHNWTDLVTSSLNCLSFGSLTNIVISVVHQLCNNIDQLTKLKLKDQVGLPPDYVISQLEAITVLCHYCLLDNTQQTTLSQLFNQAYPQTSSIASQNSNTGQLFNSIVHSLLPGGGSTSVNTNASQADVQAPKNQQLMAARNAVLSHLPRIVSSVAAIWDSDLGQIRQIKQQLMEFLSPISLHHGANFLAAIAVTWQERGELHRNKCAHEYKNLSIPQQYQRNSTPQACSEQLSLVSLVSSIRVMPMDSFVQTLHQVVKSPPPIHRPPSNLKIEVSALELFYFYMKSAPAPQLADSWTSLLALLKDGLSLTPPAQFTLLMLLNEFVQRCPQMPFQDKKDIRDLHDVTSRLVDSLSNVAGSCLEQTTWLRRNLAVKEDITPLVTDGDTTSTSSTGGTAVIQKYSVQAQSVLAAILANLLDVAYGSQEKDKVVSIITTLLYNITPYLKNHTTRNIPSFYACSSLLASLSGYQYTRKAWRKDMMDLLLDTSFFQMDITCLPFWKQIMDSLMTYDNTTFRELMSRVSLTQTGSLNIFTSREQEYEQRSMLLKRLAFVIFCSEFDQYHKYMPEIQEQLANSLRLLSNVPSVQAAVFLCFRVLLLRMSSDHVTSLWPIIIAEMVQVFLSLEQELKGDGEDVSRMVSGMDASWSSSTTNNGMSTQSQVYYWRSVQLEASKLLEMGCVLPATLLPHFQMYRWAFVGTEFDATDKGPIPNGVVSNEESVGAGTSASYVPHIRRIARLMDMKYTVHSPTLNFKRGKHLMLTCQQINSLQDLYGFFSTLSVACPNPHNHADVDSEISNCLQEIEDILSKDFLEKMPTSTTPR